MSNIKIKDTNLVENITSEMKLPVGNTGDESQPLALTVEQIKDFTLSGLSTVATTGSFNDLTDKPDLNEYAKISTLNTNYYNKTEINSMIGSGGGSLLQVQTDWNQTDSSAVDYIKNKPNLSNIATTGSYTDLLNKPTIPNKTRTLLITYGDGSTERIEVYTVK